MIHRFRSFAAILLCLLAAPGVRGDEETALQPVRHRVAGLFSPDRQDDLRQLVADLPGLTLVRIDYDTAEALFTYDPAGLFPDAKPEQTVERLDRLLRHASRHTFGIRPLCETPREKLERLEIGVEGLDCKGCALAAYESIAGIDGVERATVSFKAGLVTAWIDPAKTDRAALEAALRQKGVHLPSP